MKNKTVIVGIDPGKTGGLAVLDVETADLIELHRFPLIVREYNVPRLVDIFEDVEERFNIGLCVIEDVHALAGKGAKATFNFGFGVGMVRAIVAAMHFAYVLAQPKAWQKIAWDGVPIQYKPGKKNGKRQRDPKATSMLAASRLFPGETFTPDKLKTPHDGLIDAALIAYAGRHKFLGKKAE